MAFLAPTGGDENGAPVGRLDDDDDDEDDDFEDVDVDDHACRSLELFGSFRLPNAVPSARCEPCSSCCLDFFVSNVVFETEEASDTDASTDVDVDALFKLWIGIVRDGSFRFPGFLGAATTKLPSFNVATIRSVATV